METVIIKMLIGMISGIGCSLISIFFEKVLLEAGCLKQAKRKRTLSQY